jgi:hypothetical protein
MVERLYLAGAPAYSNIEAGSAKEAVMQGKSFEARFFRQRTRCDYAVSLQRITEHQRHIVLIRRAVPVVSSTAIDAYIPVWFDCGTWKECNTVHTVQVYKGTWKYQRTILSFPSCRSANRQPAIYKVKISKLAPD